MIAAVRPVTVTRSRSDWLWVLLPYAVLVATVLVTVFTGSLGAHDVLPAIIVIVLLVAWHGWWVIAHPQWLETRLAPMAVYFAGFVVATNYLTELSMTFYPLYLVCYAMAFVALPGVWAYVGVGVTAVVGLLGPAVDTWSLEAVVIPVGGAALICVVGGSIRALEKETARRRAAIATLERTQADLEHSLHENRALQGRLIAEARDTGVVTERARLAGEIHDTLAAGLAGIVTQLEALDAHLPPEHPTRDRLHTSLDLARESLQEARRSVRALRPGPLVEATLPEALATVVERFKDTRYQPVELTVVGDAVAVPEAVEDVLLRVTTEALTNVERHAQATAVHVTLTFLNQDVAVDIVDNGVGFTVAAPGTDTSGSHGLTIMSERVKDVGGQLAVDSVPRQGTTVTAIIPSTPAQGERRWGEDHATDSNFDC